jgi:hypothetical protein
VPATSATFLALFYFFFAPAMNSNNETNKGRRYVPLISLSFLDGYGSNPSASAGREKTVKIV